MSDGQRSVGSPSRTDVRDAWTVVRAEVRVRLRRLRTDRRTLLGNLTTVALFGVFVPWLAREGVVAFGANAADGSVPVGSLGAGYTAFLVVLLYVGGGAGVSQEATGRIGPLVRTSVPPRAVSLGRLTSELALAVAVFVLPTVPLLVLVWAGAGDPLVPLTVGLGAVPLFLAALVVGRLVGDALRLVNDAVRVSVWVKAAVFVAVSGVGFVASQRFFEAEMGAGEGGLSALSVPALLPGTPVQAYATVVTAPLGTTVRPLGWAVGALSVLAVAVGLAAALQVETRLLFRESAADAETVAGTRGVPWPFTLGRSPRVAWRYLLRTRRDPRTLSHLFPLLFMGLASAVNVYRDPGEIFAVGPPTAVIGASVVAGAAYCMNPLGDDVDQLPLLLTSTGSTDALLQGRALAGAALGLPLALGVGVPLAAAGESPLYAVWLAVLSVVLVAAGTGVALGIGALVPKFEQREYMSVERPHPSNYAVFGHLAGAMVAGGAGVVLVGQSTTPGAGPLLGAAWAVYLLVVGGAGIGGYVYAVRRFDALSLDDF